MCCISLSCKLEKQLIWRQKVISYESIQKQLFSFCITTMQRSQQLAKISNPRQLWQMLGYGMIPVMPSVSDGPVTAQFVTFQLVECMLPVRVFSSLQQLGRHIGLLIKTSQAISFCLWWPGYLKERQNHSHCMPALG